MKFRPLAHKLLVRAEFYDPNAASAQSLGFVRTPSDYLPTELPALLRTRLIRFLMNSYPIPPAYLQPLVDAREAEEARRVFKAFLKLGYTPGEAILQCGILDKKEWHNVPNWSKAEILAAGCSCCGPVGTIGFIASSAGIEWPGDPDRRIIECAELSLLDVTNSTGKNAKAPARARDLSRASRSASVRHHVRGVEENRSEPVASRR